MTILADWTAHLIDSKPIEESWEAGGSTHDQLLVRVSGREWQRNYDEFDSLKRSVRRIPESLNLEPDSLAHIVSAIDRSRRILQLEDNWDEEGSPGYSETVWAVATKFVYAHARWLWRSRGVSMKPPRILPGPDGSIDVHWNEPDFNLLFNFPASPSALATFYGDDRRSQTVKGTFDPTNYDHEFLPCPMKRC